MAWVWVTYAIAVLAISAVVGLHLGRFREAYTEMTGMMAGMTMGMMNGFVLGYAAAAAVASTSSGANTLLWGNAFGMLLGLLLGVYFGRAGGLMGMMDGGMGGVMGGSMGAMLAAMLVFPREALLWTILLLTIIYLLSMVGLVVLIEQSAPEHAALHRLLPFFTPAVAAEVEEEVKRASETSTSTPLNIIDYYAFLGIAQDAASDAISDAYLAKLASADDVEVERADRALAILTNPTKRAAYDRRLQESLAASDGRGACCPPPRKKKVVAPATGEESPAAGAQSSVAAASATAKSHAASEPVPAKAPAGNTHATKNNGGNLNRQRIRTQPQAPYAQSRVQGRNAASRRKKEMPVSWVGIVAGAVIVVMLLGWWLLSQGGGTQSTAAGIYGSAGSRSAWGNTSPQAAQLEARAVTVPVGADGKQTLDFAINGDTWKYEPDVIKVKQGVPVHLNLSVKGRDPGCARVVIFRGLDVYSEAVMGKVVPIDFTPTKPGIYEINCGMHMMQSGYVIVQ